MLEQISLALLHHLTYCKTFLFFNYGTMIWNMEKITFFCTFELFFFGNKYVFCPFSKGKNYVFVLKKIKFCPAKNGHLFWNFNSLFMSFFGSCFGGPLDLFWKISKLKKTSVGSFDFLVSDDVWLLLVIWQFNHSSLILGHLRTSRWNIIPLWIKSWILM